MKNYLAALTIAGSFACTAAAHADTLSIFQLSEATFDGTGSGTITIDITTGQVTNTNYTIAFLGTNYFFTSQNGPTGTIFVDLFSDYLNATNYITLPVSTLVGFTGSQLCSVAVACITPSTTYDNLSFFKLQPLIGEAVTSGSLTLVSSTSSPVPEPSSFVLLGSGLVIAAVRIRRR